jgi:hypothetical protein
MLLDACPIEPDSDRVPVDKLVSSAWTFFAGERCDLVTQTKLAASAVA